MKKTKSCISIITIIVFCFSIININYVNNTAYALTISEREQIIYNFLRNELNFNCAAACGVLANIYYETNRDYEPDTHQGGGGPAYGLCQWENPRQANLKTWCANNGYDYKSLEGQLYFIKWELLYDKSNSLQAESKMRAADNSAQGAYNAAKDWCIIYERPAGASGKIERFTYARDVLWPKYCDNVNYTVYLNANGGEVNPGSITVQSGGTYSGLPTPSRSGYDFAGWFDDGSRQVWDGLNIYTNGDHTLYAHWNPRKHNVWLNANGGEVSPGVIEVQTDGTYNGLPTPGRYGYDFAGWFDDSGRQVWDGLGIYTNAEHTLSARWNPKSIKVNLNVNGGSVSPDSIQVNFDDKYNNLPSAEKTGYNFNGWFTEKGNGTQVDFNSVCKTVDEHTLYAHWSKDKYMITFNAMGGTVRNANKLVVYDNKYGILPTPERTGYEFKGWYLEEDCTNEITSVSTVKITANQDIYAKWELRKYYIAFDANGGTVDIANKQVTAEKKYGVLPTPEKTNSRFVGWYTDENIQISSSSIVELESNTTLYAKWILIGDVNLDEEINVADAVSLQKYLLGQEKIGYNEYLAGDINEDGSADVFDMVLMRQLLIVK